jgi:hypothetical protein
MKLRESDIYFSIKRAASAKMAASAWPLRHGRFGMAASAWPLRHGRFGDQLWRSTPIAEPQNSEGWNRYALSLQILKIDRIPSFDIRYSLYYIV